MKLAYIPNIISFVRLFLIIPVVAALFLKKYDVALFVFLIADCWRESLIGCHV